MAANKKSAEEIQASTIRFLEIVRSVTSVVRWAITFGVLAFGIHEAASVLTAWSGKSTTADVLVRFIADLKANQWFAILFGFGGTAYGLAERRLRKKTVTRLSRRNDQFEKKQDPRKSSSGLNERGDTRNEDR